jgi:hypothetical protein
VNWTVLEKSTAPLILAGVAVFGVMGGVIMLMGALAYQMYLYIKSSGLGKKDFSVVTKMFEDLMNVKLRL